MLVDNTKISCFFVFFVMFPPNENAVNIFKKMIKLQPASVDSIEATSLKKHPERSSANNLDPLQPPCGLETQSGNNTTTTNPSQNSTKSHPTLKYYTLAYKIVGITLVGLIFIAGIIGNCLVILVASRKTTSTTNLYIISLAISDLTFMLAGCLPSLVEFNLPVHEALNIGNIGCCVMVFLQYLSVDSSILSITAFTIERYIAVCKPLSIRLLRSRPRTLRILIFLCIVSSLYCSPWLFLVTGFTFKYGKDTLNRSTPTISNNSSLFCQQNSSSPLNTTITPSTFNQNFPDASDRVGFKCTFKLARNQYLTYYLADMIIFYLSPLIIISVLYFLVGLKLMQTEKLKTTKFNKTYSFVENHEHKKVATLSRSVHFCSLEDVKTIQSSDVKKRKNFLSVENFSNVQKFKNKNLMRNSPLQKKTVQKTRIQVITIE